MYDAIGYALENYSFRSGSQKIVIVITDERPNNNVGYSDDDIDGIIRYAVSQNAQVYTMISEDASSHNNSAEAIADYRRLSADTNGVSYNITDSFEGILDSIREALSQTYIVTYRIADPVLNGEERKVEIGLESSVSDVFTESVW